MVLRIGVDLGGTKVEAIALDEGGRALVRRRTPTPRHDYAATLRTVTELVVGIEGELGQQGTVGIGMPGALSPATGRVKNSNSIWLNDRPLAEDLPRLIPRVVRQHGRA